MTNFAMADSFMGIFGMKRVTTDRHIESVRQKMLERSQRGLQKYGVTLERTDLTTLDWLRHAQEEAMDLAGYLQVLIDKEENK